MAVSVLGFAYVGVLAFGGVGKHYSQERGQALLWGSFHFFSIGLSIGGAKLVAHYVQNSIAWPVAGFLSAATYLVVVGTEPTVAYLWDHRRER
jgi:hypothetical protein